MIELPECPICLETFDLGERAPMILPCGHTICHGDMQLLVEAAAGAGTPPRCPSCKERFQYQPSPEHGNVGRAGSSSSGVTRNYALQQLLENALRLTGGLPPQAIPKCPQHPLCMLEFWCQECAAGVCPKCFLQQHQKHTMHSLEDVFKAQAQPAVEAALALGEAAVAKAEAHLALVRDRRARLLAAHEAAKREVAAQFDLLVAAALRRRAALLAEADRVWAEEVHAAWDGEERAAAERHADLARRLEELRTLRDKSCFLPLMEMGPRARRVFEAYVGEDGEGEEEEEDGSRSRPLGAAASAASPVSLAAQWDEAGSPERLAAQVRHAGRIEVQWAAPGPSGSGSNLEGGLGLAATTAPGGFVTARGAGLDSVVLGQAASFVVTAFGPDGRRRLRGGEDDLIVAIHEERTEGSDGDGGGDGGLRASPATIPTIVRDRHDGTYEVVFTPSVAGCDDEESVSVSGGGGGGGGGRLSPSLIATTTTTSTTTSSSSTNGLGLRLGGLGDDAWGPRFLRLSIAAHRRPTTRTIGGGSSLDRSIGSSLGSSGSRRRGPHARHPSQVEEAIEEERDLVVLVDKGGPSLVVGGPAFRVRVHAPFQGAHVGTLGGGRGGAPGCFQGPGSLAVDGDFLWVADGDNHRVQVLDLARNGAFVAQYGCGGGSSSGGIAFRSPYGVAVDDACAYVAERDGHRVVVLDKADGRVLRTIGEQARMRDPLAVAVDERLVGVTDSSLNRVLFFEKRTGRLAHVLGPALPTEAGGGCFACPCDVVFDAEDDSVYITDREASRILVFDTRTWGFRRQIGSHGVGLGEFSHVNRLCLAQDRLYATDRFGCRVVGFNKHTGDHACTFGGSSHSCGSSSHASGGGGGGGGGSLLDRPNGVAFYRGHLLVADYEQSRVHVFR